jgi:nucleoside-diphosphate-sugar epimerase
MFTGGLDERESLMPFLDNCKAIIHTAGLTRAKEESEFLRVNREGTENLVKAALSLPSGPRHIIAMSSQAVMGPNIGGFPSSEDDPMRPLTPYGRSKVAMEAALLEYETEGSMRCTCIRAPGVYGPRDQDFLHYFQLVKHGLRLIVGTRKIMSLVYIKTLAEAVERCILNPNAYGQAFFITDPSPCDWDEFSIMIERALGKKTIRIQLPEALVGATAPLFEMIKPFVKEPLLLDKNKLLEMCQQSWVLSIEKARRVLGFTPETGTAEAIEETCRWYRDQGWL